MGKARKLLEKTSKLGLNIKSRVQGREIIDKIESVLMNNPAVFKLVKGSQRRLDEAYSQEFHAVEPTLSFETVATALARVDFDEPNEDFGMLLSLPAGIISASAIQPGDEVVFLEGSLESRALEIITVESNLALRLDDVATFGSSENEVRIRFNISSSEV